MEESIKSDTISLTTKPDSKPMSVSEVVQEKMELAGQISEYSFVIIDSIYLLFFGIFIIFALQKLAGNYLYPYLKDKRFIKVLIGTMYVLVLVFSVLLTLRNIGFELQVLGPILILSVLIISIITFFLLPYLPRLPFKIGHMIEVNDVIGIVDSISSYHITIRKFNSSIVFIPNAVVMTSRITNHFYTPDRRIEMKLIVKGNTNIDKYKALLQRLMEGNNQVLKNPAEPAVFIVNASTSGIEMEAFCWVKNEDWLSARSDLWQTIINAFNDDDRFSMSRPQQEIYVLEGNKL